MNSKSLDATQSVVEHLKANRSFAFVKLYKSAAETKGEQFETTKVSKTPKKLKSPQTDLGTSKRSGSPNKNKKKKVDDTLDFSSIEAGEHKSKSSKVARSSRKSSLTSTPKSKDEHVVNGVKSIMKSNTNDGDSLLNVSNASTPTTKPKKRNKSVSFMLEDAEEVVLKKSKSNEPSKERKKEKESKNKENLSNNNTSKRKKVHEKKDRQNVSENIMKSNNKDTFDAVEHDDIREKLSNAPLPEEFGKVKKKGKKAKKGKPEGEWNIENNEANVPSDQTSDNKQKKAKKKKRKVKSEDGNTDAMAKDSNTDAEGEPATKTRKKDIKPEAIAKGLENLNIGDNPHTLTNMLDEMTVVDKNKNKKERQKLRKNKRKHINSEDKQEELQGANAEEKEKVKWSNRKWNKDTKDGKSRLLTSVVVDNLPIKIVCNYKPLLSEHFSKFGTIAGIGVVETYPAESLKPVFTTTVFFQEEEAATKALEEDNTVFEGKRIRVRRPLPPTETTLVVRSYALSDQALSTLFSSAGRIRSIRQTVKGKKSISTAFVEFDGLKSVEKALKLAEDKKIGGKKMYVSKYMMNKEWRTTRSDNNSANDGESDSSSD